MFSACPCAASPVTFVYAPTTCAFGTVPEARFDAFRLPNAAPLPVKALLALFNVNALLYVPNTTADGTVPLAKLLAFKLDRPDPTPVMTPPFVTTMFDEIVTLDIKVCPPVQTLVEPMIPLLPVTASTYAFVAASLGELGVVTLLIR